MIKKITKKTSAGTETHDIGAEASNVTMSNGTTVEAAVSSHIGSKSNPHGVTKSQVGLGNVPNVVTNDQTPTFSQASSRSNIASGEKLNTIFGKIMKFFADLKAVAFSGSYTDLVNKPTSMTPTSHANSSTTYGAGNGSNYGHLKLSAATNSTSGVSGGTAATPSAVKAAYDLAASKAASNHTHTAASVGALSTEGGTITGSLTVGTRSGSIGENSLVVGGGTTNTYAPNTASGKYSAIIGAAGSNVSGALSAVVGGGGNAEEESQIVTGGCSVILGGYGNEVDSEKSAIIGGIYNYIGDTYDYSAIIASTDSYVEGRSGVVLGGNCDTALAYQVKTGHYATNGTAGSSSGTTGDALIIGNGKALRSRSNAARITYAGDIYAAKSINGTGAGYGHVVEWLDGNPNAEDRRGYFVTLVGDKIKIFNPEEDEFLYGVVSDPDHVSFIANNQADQWHKMYKHDVYGKVLTHEVEHEAYIEVRTYTDPDGTEHNREIEHEAYTAVEPILNEAYNPNEKYIPRLERAEWDVVEHDGFLIVNDDGSCAAGEYCTIDADGKATSGSKASKYAYFVMKRLDDTHIQICK